VRIRARPSKKTSPEFGRLFSEVREGIEPPTRGFSVSELVVAVAVGKRIGCPKRHA